MRIHLIIILSTFLSCSCGNKRDDHQSHSENKTSIKRSSFDAHRLINPEGRTILERINTPLNFNRVRVEENSFGHYLRLLPLKAHNANVKYYNGVAKPNRGIYMAVVDLDIGDKNLQQCADAVIRLRAEYLYHHKAYNKIHFNFTNGFRVDYDKWMKGNRVVVNGNEAYWRKSALPSNTSDDLWNYLELVFTYAGTLSLEKELQPVPLASLSIGDVFIQGDSPGHAVIVVDVATNTNTNQKIFLLAQSYMPAQEIQILQNPTNDEISPWYETDFDGELITPEWIFDRNDLMRFED